MNFGESLRIQSLRSPDKIAVEDDFKTITYRELNARVNRLAHGMLDLGLKKGDIICQLQGNSIEHIEVLYAIAKLGMIRLPLNPRAEKSEWVHIINSFEPEALVFEKDFAPLVNPLRPQLKCQHYIYSGPASSTEAIPYEYLSTKFPQSEPPVDVKEEDPYLVQSTSGTTGFPKATLLSHGGMIRRAVIRAIDLNNHSNGVYLGVTALANTASVFYGLSQLYIGGRVILRNRFDPEETLRTIEQKKVTIVSMVPVMWERIVQAPNLEGYDLSSLRIALSYGAPFHQAFKEKFMKHLSPNLVETFGITETGPITNLLPQDQLRKINSVGQPTMHTRIKIIGSGGIELPVGQEGEIIVQTPYLFMGYLNNPEETLKVLRTGWFYTGDIGRIDDEQYLYIMGRSKDMIISGGYNIYAEEVESVLAAHPMVQEVAVIGVPSEKWGEAVKAVIVRKPGTELSETEIIDFCKTRLASYKKPQSIDFVSNLPRSGAGKVAKSKLKEKYWEGFDREVH
jgi:fatty-acyl-CoA synthase